MENEFKNFALEELNLIGNLAVLIDSELTTETFVDIIEVLKNKQIKFKLIEITPNGLNLLDPKFWKEINRVFIAISDHHKLSTGYIQAILDILGLDYTGTGMLSAALTKDIFKVKKIWQIMGIATTPFIKWKEDFDWQEMLGLIGLPMAIKSLNINEKKIFKVTNLENIDEILKKFDYSNDIIIEPWITGDEYIVYIINETPLVPIKINSTLTSNFNIISSQSHHNQSEELYNIKNMQKLAVEAFLAIGGQGFAEVHILKDVNEDCWVLSINIGLNLNRNSNFAIAAYEANIKFEELIEKILATSFIKKSCNNLIQLV